MSFFGQNSNNQQQGTGFGGFGSNNNNNNTGGFGQPATSGAGFGGANTNTSGGFGGFGSGGGSAFGSTTSNNSPFGQSKPAFGASTSTGGGGLFGGGTTTAGGSSGFGGFGNNNNNTTSGGGLFGGAPKPAFGGGSTGGSLFGNSTNTGGFGSTNNQITSAFGAPVSSALSQNSAVCEGTGSTPFTQFTEKESPSGATNHFQSISFMAPYKNFSFEELRLADYNQGRRFGNGSGQAGAFGSTNFGGFGQQNNASGGFGQPANTSVGGLFGSTTATAPAFSGTQSSGFGSSNTGSSLFGQKPGGLFGAASSSQSTGGLFGTANNATSSFGSGNTTGGFGSGVGGLFGQNNNQQQQSKPFSFGSTTATAGGGGFGSGGTGFGSTNNNSNTGGGLFGQSNPTTNNTFGQQNNTQTSNPFGGFGQQNQNQPQNQSAPANPFGGFGQPNQEQKPGGLFGNTSTNTNTGGGAFGTQNNNQTGGGLFGQANNNQPAGNSLFGQKPATGGLFGQGNTNASNTGGGLFGGFGNNPANQQQNQPTQGGGLFGNTNNQQKPGGLFGGTNSNTGSNMFGTNNTNNNQQPSGGLFNLGGSNNQPQQQAPGGGLFGNSTTNNAGSSLFGTTQQQQSAPQNQFQPSATLQTSINDPNAFGSPSIFSGLPPPPQVSGPIATPISQKNKQKKNALLPLYKLTPNSPSRLQTPQKRGFGFSYSTYGTPGSASSNASTPGGLGSSIFQSSYNRGLGKSLSTSNLRGNYGDTESVLTPGAFSAGSSRYGGAGSMKKLTIDRSLRTDLFGDRGTPLAISSPDKERQPGILKKKVSFDASTVGGNGGQPSGAQPSNDLGDNTGSSATPSAEEQGFLRSPKSKVPAKPNGISAQPEMEQVRGNELAIVPEDESPVPASAPQKRATAPKSQEDPEAGDYWMTPSKNEIQKMTKEQRRQLSGFKVGRIGCGKVEFNEPVDVTNINLDDIYDNIAVINLRSLTVYPDQSKKPALGKGLNVPSTIYLENSWPRTKDRKSPSYEKSGSRFNKHVDRLRKVTGTEFITYDKETGIWSFKVPHFTTYGFDYDDDASEGESLHMSTMTDPPDTPTPMSRGSNNGPTPRVAGSTQRSVAPTKRSSQLSPETKDVYEYRQKRILPGAFDEAPVFEDEEDDEDGSDDHEMMDGTTRDLSFSDEHSLSPSDSGEEDPSEMQDVVNEDGDQPVIVRDDDKEMELEMAGAFPGQDEEDLTKMALANTTIGVLNVSGDWALELQQTVRPMKQDRQALRNAQMTVLQDKDDTLVSNSSTPSGRLEITTHTDLMNMLYGEPQTRKGKQRRKAMKEPVLKSSLSNVKPGTPTKAMIPEPDRQWHDLVSSTKECHSARLRNVSNLTSENLTLQRAHTTFAIKKDIPMAAIQQTPFRDFAIAVEPDSDYENSVWSLASILFDDQDCTSFGVPASQKDKYDSRIRKDRLITFWQGLCDDSAQRAADEASNAEERAIAHLSVNKIFEACEALVQGKDYRLATLVSQIQGDHALHEQISAQVEAWRDLNVLSEMSEPIRALYSLLAGKTCVCEGIGTKHIEDKARTFPLSERFGLDWRRAFGLRLFYSITTEEPIEAAIVKFADDLKDKEPAKPGDDIFYTLLQLYAASKGEQPTPSFAHNLAQPTTSPSPLTARLSFQIYHAATIRFPSSSDAAAADTLATTFATQLDEAGEWLWAMFALLHLSDPAQRQQYIQALLAHHAKDIDADPQAIDRGTWTTLIDELKIPESWIWEAKALYARAVDSVRMIEAECLVKAGNWSQAHDVLTRIVGPECVIAEEWTLLRELLDSFKAGKENIDNWGLGGLIYEDFLDLVSGEVGDKKRRTVLNRLLETLPTVARDLEEERKKHDVDANEKEMFRQMVALQEISRVVGQEVLALKVTKGIETAKVLQLPSTEDAYAKYTMELSWRYYRAVMAGSGSLGGRAGHE